MGKKHYIFMIIILVISFVLFSNDVGAIVKCDVNKKSNTEVTFHIYDTSDTEHDGSYVSLKLDDSTNKISRLNICGESIIQDGNNVSKYDLSSKKSFNCDIAGGTSHTVSFGSVNLTGKFYKLTNSMTCGVAYPSTVNITGLKNAPEETTSNAIMCSGASYNFIVRKGQDNQAECDVTIQQDKSDDDVIMKHGSQTTKNPRAGKYTCETPVGDTIEFFLSKNLDKGSLKSENDCPKLQAASGTDGTQAEIEGHGQARTQGGGTTTTTDTISSKEIKTNLNYGSICGNEGVQTAFKVLGTVIFIVKILAPLLIIVFGMIDYFNAVTSSDENALSKATESLIKRLVSGIVIFFIPTLLWGILNLLDITDGIHDLNNTEFGACTRCLLKNECK